jgi:hypothetical protein
MKVVMDSDCLVKLTNAGAKGIIADAMEIYIPYLVKKETVDAVRDRGFKDSLIIKENIEKKILQVIRHKKKTLSFIPITKGEMEVVSHYLNGGFDAIASDDRKFLRKLESANIPFLTPAACVIYAYESGKIKKHTALELLNNLKIFISNEEYTIAKMYMEGIS